MKIKDLYGEESIGALAEAVQQSHPGYEPGDFMACVFDEAWQQRELKERTRHITVDITLASRPSNRRSMAGCSSA